MSKGAVLGDAIAAPALCGAGGTTMLPAGLIGGAICSRTEPKGLLRGIDVVVGDNDRVCRGASDPGEDGGPRD